MQLTLLPYGLGHAGEGVCLVMTLGPHRVMLDCGLTSLEPLLAGDRQEEIGEQQGRQKGGRADRAGQTNGQTTRQTSGQTSKQTSKQTSGPIGGDRRSPADLVICSHAHPDHSRGLRQLQAQFPNMPLYATQVTARLLALDGGPDPKAPSPEGGDEPVAHGLGWRSRCRIAEGLTVEFWPAGHLPGAAITQLCYTPPQRSPVARGLPPRTYSVVYSGDFLLSSSRLTDGLPLDDLRNLKPDVLILEGSQGTARHPRRRQQENRLAERIVRALEERQSVLLPVPSLGLGQEILMLLRSHHQFTGRDLDIWVEARVAEGCDRYLEILPELPEPVQNFARHQPLFWDERVKPRVRRLQGQQRLTQAQMPCVVLTHPESNWGQYVRIPNSSWLLLLPDPAAGTVATQGIDRRDPAFQYQSERSLRTLETIGAEGRLSLDNYLLAEHCDGAGTTQFIHNLRPQNVVLVHGSATYLSDLAGLEELQSRYHLHLPSQGQRLELPVSNRFLQPTPPEQPYDGELIETDTQVLLSLPDRITDDPRWTKFATTGLLEVRWQGEDLVLHAVSPRALRSQAERQQDYDMERYAEPYLEQVCQNCFYYHSQHCRNPTSMLVGMAVPPEGQCPVFRRSASP